MIKCLLISVQKHIFIFCTSIFVGLFFSFAYSIEPLIIECSLLPDDQTYVAVLEKQFPTSCLLEKLSIFSDITIQEEEIRYLLDINEGMIISIDTIKRSCSNLQKKHKFNQVQFCITQGSQGNIIDLYLIGSWTFSKIFIEGLLLGKDSYKQYYFLEPGELFDIKKHYDSCKKIKNILFEQGYFNGNIADFLSYDRPTKTVDTTLVIDRGSRFFIDEVYVVCKDISPIYDAENILDKVRKILNSRLVWKYFSKDLVNNETYLIKRYLAKKGFVNASLYLQKHFDRSGQKVTLTFYIALHKKREFVFFGNHFFTKEQLLDTILAFGRSAWLLPVEILVEELQNQYRDKGFWNIHIECQQDEERIFFLIQEGPRSSIEMIEIHGVSSPLYLKYLKKLYKPCIKQPFYDENVLRRVLAQTRTWYEQRGFWNVQILHQEYVPLEKRNVYTLVLTIDEGTQYYLSDVCIKGFSELRNCGPFATISPDFPQVFDIRLLQAQRDWLIGYMKTHGYLYSKITSDLEYNGSLVTVIWNISGCQEQVTFGKTIVRGIVPFPFKHVVSHLEYEEHDVWNSEQLEKSLLQFRDLGIFETIQIFPDNIADISREKSVILKLVEDNPFEVRFRAGFQQVSKNFAFKSGSTYKVGGSCAWKNPFHAADQFFFNADVTRFYRNIVAAYHRPWLGNTPIHMLIKGYAHKYIQPVFVGSDKPLYTAIQQGILLGLRRHISYIDTGCSIGFEIMETRGISKDLAQAINFEPTLIDKKVPHIFFEPSLFVDLLDNTLNPSRGSYSVLSCKGMFPWKKHSTVFFKILFEHAHFFSIKSVVVALRIRFGHIFNQKFSNIMPPERFYLGGENSIRSIEKDMGPPLGKFIDEKNDVILVPQGGRSMVNGNFEVRVPLFRDFGMVFFQDIGTLIENSFSEIKGGKLLGATGFGLRYHTPVGPLRFDIAWRWNRQDHAEPRYAWFLTFGHAF